LSTADAVNDIMQAPWQLKLKTNGRPPKRPPTSDRRHGAELMSLTDKKLKPQLSRETFWCCRSKVTNFTTLNV